MATKMLNKINYFFLKKLKYKFENIRIYNNINLMAN